MLQDALEMPQIWAPDLASRGPRIELQEEKESMTCLFKLLHALNSELFLTLNVLADPIVPDSMISPVAKLADKYNVTGLVKAFFCATTLNSCSREPFWQSFILGTATKDVRLCCKSLRKSMSITQSVFYWSQVDAHLVGLDVYWALVKATQDCIDLALFDPEYDVPLTDRSEITQRVDWPKALGI